MVTLPCIALETNFFHPKLRRAPYYCGLSVPISLSEIKFITDAQSLKHSADTLPSLAGRVNPNLVTQITYYVMHHSVTDVLTLLRA